MIPIITKVASPRKPVGAFNVHFEEATENIDLFNLVADTNLETRKSVLYLPEWPVEVEELKTLFIPK